MIRLITLGLLVLAFAGCQNEWDTPGGDSKFEDLTTPEGEQVTPPNDYMPPTDPTPRGQGEEPNASDKPAGELTAFCNLVAIGDSGVSGGLTLKQEGDKVVIEGTIEGLSPGKHGFHVHESGDLSDKTTGESVGGHFNPTGAEHGRPGDENRHVGDLGNIEADDDGVARIKITDEMIKLNGDHSVLGRAIVVHQKADTFGQPSGEAGGRVAFGKIEPQK